MVFTQIYTDSEIFTKKSEFQGQTVKKRILTKKLIPYNCSICGLQPLWNNSLLTLQLDHINGLREDNRLENLRFLCPNCHSQTNTYAGKNLQRAFCERCKMPVCYDSKICRQCFLTTKIEWPPISVLVETLNNNMGIHKLAKQLGVTGNTLHKRLKKHGAVFKDFKWTISKLTI